MHIYIILRFIIIKTNMKCHCGKSLPFYNLPGLKPEYCSECKTDEMIDIRHKSLFEAKNIAEAKVNKIP